MSTSEVLADRPEYDVKVLSFQGLLFCLVFCFKNSKLFLCIEIILFYLFLSYFFLLQFVPEHDVKVLSAQSFPLKPSTCGSGIGQRVDDKAVLESWSLKMNDHF